MLQIIFKDIQFLEKQTATLEVENIGQVGVFVRCFYQIFLQLCPPVHTALFACLSIKCYSYSLQPLLALFPCKFIPFIIRSGHWINYPNNSNTPLDRQAMRTRIIINYRIFRTWLGILRTNPQKKFIDGVSFQRNCGAAR